MPRLSTSDIYQTRFEHTRVRMLVNALGLPDDDRRRVIAMARDEGRQRGYDGYLKFDALFALDRFATFPVYFTARNYSGTILGQLDVSYVLRFRDSFLYEDYMALRDEYSITRSRPFAMAIGLPGLLRGVVVHDADLPVPQGGTALVYRSPVAGEPVTVTMEPYRLFVERLAAGWAMAQPAVPRAALSADMAGRLEAWMVRRLGSGPAAVVLAWLTGAWNDERRQHVVVRAGRPWLCLTHRVIADATGLKVDSVKRALATLRQQGLIATERGNRTTYAALTADGNEVLGGL